MSKFDNILLLTDLDGTLLYNAEMPDKNRAAIKYFIENGGIFSVATGRAPDFIKKKIPYINAPVCSLNGAVIYDLKEDKIIKEYFLPKKSVNAASEVSGRYKPVRINVFSLTENAFINPKPFDFDGFDKRIHKIVFIFDSEEVTMSAKKYLCENGALNALMTGSGSAVFGLFTSAPAARAAAQSLRPRWRSTCMSHTCMESIEEIT